METSDLVPGLRAAEYTSVNEVVKKLSGSNEKNWHVFASAWTALVYRLRAAREHAAAFSASLAVSSGPLPEQRYQQEKDLFVFAASALSAVECFFFATYFIGAFVKPTAFPLAPDDLKYLRPEDVRARFGAAFSGDLTTAMQGALKAPEYEKLVEDRNVLSHRGVLPRAHSLAAGGPDRPSTIPSNPKDSAPLWRFDRELMPNMLDQNLAWLESTVNELVVETARFVNSLPGAVTTTT